MLHPKRTQASQLPLDLSELTATAPPLTLDHLTTLELHYLRGPVTLALATARTCGASVQPQPNGWDFPDRLRPIIPAARWLQVRRGRVDPREKDLASEEEALGYTSTGVLWLRLTDKRFNGKPQPLPHAVRCKCLLCQSRSATVT